jgi:hypothetical protein
MRSSRRCGAIPMPVLTIFETNDINNSTNGASSPSVGLSVHVT